MSEAGSLDAVNAVDSPALVRRRRLIGADRLEQYRRMVEIRTFEDRINRLFAEGLVHGTTHTCQGQEALDVALAGVLQPTDTVCCTYRGHGIALALGMPPEVVLGEIMGRTTGCLSGLGGSMHLCDPDIGLLPTFAIVGAGIPVAAGAALAHQMKGDGGVAVAVFGDGGSNIGAFHEGLNLAAVWHLPVVFVCDNNLYGEYSRIDKTTAVTDISRRASSYAIPGSSVDGMDVGELEQTLGSAVRRAREGHGPSLIEVRTYRFAGHSRADQALYRPEGELDEWRRRDPLGLLRSGLRESGVGETVLTELEAEAVSGMERVVAETTAAAEPSREDLLRHVWANAPAGWMTVGGEE
jgi:pyruvate dehydrogenase E1 component alpha subunit